MNCNFCLFFNFFVPKAYFFKVLDGALFLWTFWVFLLWLSNFKMTSTTLNISFHIDLGKFVSDWTCIIQKIRIVALLKLTTLFIWIILKILYELVQSVFLPILSHCNLHLPICHIWAQIWYLVLKIVWKLQYKLIENCHMGESMVKYAKKVVTHVVTITFVA
jgi:hypothetical protein